MEEKEGMELEQRYQKLESKKTLLMRLDETIPWSELGAVLDDENQGDEIWADSAYRSQLIESVLEMLKFLSHIHERAYRNRPLTKAQKEANRQRSKVRAKVEHVFGSWVNSMGGKLMRSIGQQSVKATIGLKNLVYNFKRYVFWERQNA